MNNSYTFGLYYKGDRMMEKCTNIGNMTGPEAFIFLDKKGYIQNIDQIPIIYHTQRRPTEKFFNLLKFDNNSNHSRFNRAMKKIDQDKFILKLKKYWWLE